MQEASYVEDGERVLREEDKQAANGRPDGEAYEEES
jgi:hypothetical protein